MLKKDHEFLINLRKKKYQNIVLNKKTISKRNELIKKILNLELNNQKVKSKKNFCCKKNYFKENLINKNFLIFYKKFNVNLKLKDNYNLINFKKKTNKDTCFCSYIHISSFIIKSKKINYVHKLNTILKINDLLILIFNIKKNSHLLDNFKKILLYERKLLKKFI